MQRTAGGSEEGMKDEMRATPPGGRR